MNIWRIWLLMATFWGMLSVPAQATDNAGWIWVDEPLLHGVWGNSDDGGKSFWGYDEYRTDGTFKSWGKLPDGRDYEAEGVYQNSFDGGQKKSCAVFLRLSETVKELTGYAFCVIVVAIDSAHYTFQDQESGEITTVYRMPASFSSPAADAR
ncbi:hypothetical protein [Shewanella sp. GXUN23E]|uniref:hypothetical protein n=1 Tax=Shewanella sp. GXUN23E TaxID=3422498 RepID=UPI003D7D1E18